MHHLVVHCKKDKYDIYIGRPSIFSNPFVIGQDGNRKEVIEQYREWLLTKPSLLAKINSLNGKNLVVELANKEP